MPGSDPLVERVNVDGTRNVIAAMQDHRIGRLIYTSSIHAIRRVETGVIDERLPYDVDNPYGAYDRAKAQATLEVLEAAQHGLRATVICPTGVIGPHDYRASMMGSALRAAARRRAAFYVDGAYDFVDVRDVAAGIISAARRGRPGESYILSGWRISLRRLFELLRNLSGRRFPILRIPGRLADLLANLAPYYYRWAAAVPRFTPYALEVLRSNSHISHAKATRELGYHARPLLETLADSLQWFLNAPAMPRARV
jgi:dihydroflavonol-4-reductase